jgi:hypothetical protein
MFAYNRLQFLCVIDLWSSLLVCETLMWMNSFSWSQTALWLSAVPSWLRARFYPFLKNLKFPYSAISQGPDQGRCLQLKNRGCEDVPLDESSHTSSRNNERLESRGWTEGKEKPMTLPIGPRGIWHESTGIWTQLFALRSKRRFVLWRCHVIPQIILYLWTLILLSCEIIMNFRLRTGHSRPIYHFQVLSALLLLKEAYFLMYTHQYSYSRGTR